MYYQLNKEIEFYQTKNIDGEQIMFAQNERTGERWVMSEDIIDFLCELEGGMKDHRNLLPDWKSERFDTLIKNLVSDGIIEKRKRIRRKGKNIEITLCSLDTLSSNFLTKAISAIILAGGLPATVIVFWTLIHTYDAEFVSIRHSILNFSLALLFFILAALIHEGSHAVTAISVGQRCTEINIGIGIPLYFAAMLDLDNQVGRLKEAAIYISGVFGEMIYDVLLFLIARQFPQIHLAVSLIVLWDVLSFIINLLPLYSFRSGYLSDGAHLLATLLGGDKFYQLLSDLLESKEARKEFWTRKTEKKNPTQVLAGVVLAMGVIIPALIWGYLIYTIVSSFSVMHYIWNYIFS